MLGFLSSSCLRNYAQNPFDCISCKEESSPSTFISLLCKEARSIAHLFHSLLKREKWRPGWLKNEWSAVGWPCASLTRCSLHGRTEYCGVRGWCWAWLVCAPIPMLRAGCVCGWRSLLLAPQLLMNTARPKLARLRCWFRCFFRQIMASSLLCCREWLRQRCLQSWRTLVCELMWMRIGLYAHLRNYQV